jgi:transcriptional regulator with XRE-family HTH domain
VPKHGQKRELKTDLRFVLAARVRELMNAHMIDTAEALGQRAGIGRNTARRILEGSNATSVDSIQAIAAVFNIEPWKLLQGNANESMAVVAPAGVVRHSSRAENIPAAPAHSTKRNARRSP